MAYNEINEVIHCFVCDPESNEQDRVFLECLNLQSEDFKKHLKNFKIDNYNLVEIETNTLSFQ